jgi:hypothetical protein
MPRLFRFRFPFLPVTGPAGLMRNARPEPSSPDLGRLTVASFLLQVTLAQAMTMSS